MDQHDDDPRLTDEQPHPGPDVHGPMVEVAGLPAEPSSDEPSPDETLPTTPAPAPRRIRLRNAVPPTSAGAG